MSTKLQDAELALAKSHQELQKRIEVLRGKIKALSERELAKSLIPVHEHKPGTTVGSGTEDVPYGKLNPKGVDKKELAKQIGSAPPPPAPKSGWAPASPPPMPAGAVAKAEKCMKCGHMHMKLDKCGEVTKSDLIDEKGKQSSNSDRTPFKEKAVSLTGDKGGVILPGSKLKKAEKKPCTECGVVSSGTHCEKCGARMFTGAAPVKKALTAGMASGAPSTLVNQLGKEALDGKVKKITKAAAPPMAKPPSGKNMGTLVPTSKPAAPPSMKMSEKTEKNVAEAYKNPQVPAEEIKKKPVKDLKNSEKPMTKGVLSDIAHKESASMGAPKPSVAGPAKQPTPGDHAQRAQQYAAAQAGAFKPTAPVVSGLSLDKPNLASPKAAGVLPKVAAAKPGIFGKLKGKLGL